MLARTKERPIKHSRNAEKKTFPWREVAREEIEKYTEAGVMLRGCRYKSTLTQKALAEALGISQHHVSEMENGKRPIGKSIAKRFAEFFSTDYRVFL
jgi:plasmid maintenance system antidote protein VapI